MKDSIAFCNTKEGMHIKARELNLKPYSLGCSCNECNKEFYEMTNKPDVIKAALNVGKEKQNDCDIYIARLDMIIKPFWDENRFKYLDAVTWNAAIEATALKVGIEEEMLEIRKLKK